MKKVSIIIPLYNLEKLIGKCIASALGQDLSPEEYEILVIDDGSTDGSLAAAEKAAQGHPNVHVYTKPNEGLSRTRNYGTDRAAGRYVMYLDADDYLEPNVLGRLVETMECGGLDMLCFEIAGIDENGNDVPLWSDGISAGNGSDVQRGVDFLQRDRFLPMVYVLPLLAGDARRQLAADGSDLARGRRVHTPRVVLRTADPIPPPPGFHPRRTNGIPYHSAK